MNKDKKSPITRLVEFVYCTLCGQGYGPLKEIGKDTELPEKLEPLPTVLRICPMCEGQLSIRVIEVSEPDSEVHTEGNT